MMENSHAHNERSKRSSNIVLAVVVLVNVSYFGWRWATKETYEGCLKEAAKAANGVHRAYADLRDLCEDRETARLLELLPPPRPQKKPPELTDAQVFAPQK